MKKILLICVILSTVLLCSCGNTANQQTATTPSTPLDLKGEWVQSNKNSDEMYQKAVISDNSMEIYWINAEDDTEMLYWAGTYIKPDTTENKYSWDSANDKEKTSEALLASGDDTKTFDYNDGKISYKVSAMGVTKNVILERESK